MNLTDWSSIETNLKLSVNDAPADFKCAILAAMDYSVCFPNEPPLDLAADGEIFERLPAKVCAWVLKAIGEMRINQRKWTSKAQVKIIQAIIGTPCCSLIYSVFVI